MAVTREEVWIPVAGGVSLHAWLFSPEDGDHPHPAITLAHGFGGLIEGGLMHYAEYFAEKGFVVLAHDHRGFGLSGGWPRQDIDPWQQIDDWRYVLTFLSDLHNVDRNRIGLFGSSYAGGHALVLAGSDARVKAVVSQIPTISGYEQGRRRNPAPEDRAHLQQRFYDDMRAQLHGAEPSRQLLISTDPSVPGAYRDPEMAAYEARHPLESPARFDHKITLRSTQKAQSYDPGVWVPRISPTPLMMIVGLQDTVTPTDLALEAFERAGEPKELITYDGGHFEAYYEYFDVTAVSAGDWFSRHLMP
jgi:fermentation-respiration switch protein FrsA (DUF1100 family)